MPRARSYKEDLLVALRDPEEAKEYLNAALEDGNQDVFLLALRDVIDANMGMTKLAQATGEVVRVYTKVYQSRDILN